MNTKAIIGDITAFLCILVILYVFALALHVFQPEIQQFAGVR